jgi:thiol-disulfide isomerase/thioredoxin
VIGSWRKLFAGEGYLERTKSLLVMMVLALLATAAWSQQLPDDGPTNEKAQKTYREAVEYLHDRMTGAALESFKKADKQDGGHCTACQRKVIKYGMELGDWKATEGAAEELIGEATTPKDIALAHYQYGVILLNEGVQRHKDEIFGRAHDEMTKALVAAPNFPNAIFGDGRALAYMKQDDAAKTRFEQFVKMKTEDTPDRQRALLYISQPELARALMAPPFSVTTLDGKRLSLDDLQGRVVLIDFWATWCGPCREALPHVRDIARKFEGQPLIVLSVSVDTDENKWKEFVAKNEMTWPQYFDHGFTGPIAKSFSVEAIPHTFTIDADGILQDEHIGDASIEGKLKKLIKRAQEKQAAEKQTAEKAQP